MDHDETDMISRCQQGDQEALKEIFDKYHKKVYSIAYGVVRQREEALDVVQEVFIKLFRSIKKFKGRSHFYTYLYRMVMNAAIDHKRKVGKQFMSSLDEEGSFEPSDEAERGPERIRSSAYSLTSAAAFSLASSALTSARAAANALSSSRLAE